MCLNEKYEMCLDEQNKMCTDEWNKMCRDEQYVSIQQLIKWSSLMKV